LCCKIELDPEKLLYQHNWILNYRVGNREDSVKADFFIWGNSVMEKKFKDGYPWRKK
jgi:hypothetical protein